jgi:ankyrin repeat protein
MAGAKPEDFDSKLAILKTAGLDIAQPQTNGNTIYHLAVAKNNLALLKRLKAFNADINAKNKDGITALQKAAMIAKDDVILKYLVEAGAKKDIKSDFEETAFDLASANETLGKDKISLEFLKPD